MKSKVYKKVMAAIATTLVAASLASCAKATPDRLESIAKDLDAETIDIDDLDDVEEDTVKDGVFFRADGDELEDYVDLLKDKASSSGSAIGVMNVLDVDDIIKFKDVEEAACYMSGETDTEENENLSEVVTVIKMEDKDAAAKVFENIIDKLEDNSDIDFDKLSKDEYEEGKKLVINIDIDDFTDIIVDIMENMMSSRLGPLAGLGDIKESTKEIKKSMREDLGDDFRMVLAIYVKNDTITVVQGSTTSEDLERLPEITSKLGISDPLKVENTDELIEGLGTYEFDMDMSALSGLAN